MAAAQGAIQVTLRCSDSFDEFETRTFTLSPDSKVPIGRASKNNTKPELMIGPDNAYIDSPTISRQHAFLTVAGQPEPCVYITDNNSMHGTIVNGTKLDPNRPLPLNNGDVLLFGANVTREQHFYTARQFTFESIVAAPSYSQGISVPDNSSDEEDIEVDEAISCPPRYGSLTNPVTIDDVDQAPTSENKTMQHHSYDSDEFDDDDLDKELEGDTAADLFILNTPVRASEQTEDRSSSPVADESTLYLEDVSAASIRHGFVDEASSESDIVSEYPGEDEPLSQMDSCASLADSDESHSDGDMEPEDNMSHYDDDDVDDDDDDEEQRSNVPSREEQMRKLLESQVRMRNLLARQQEVDMHNIDDSDTRGNFADLAKTPETKDQNHDAKPTETGGAARSDGPESSQAPFQHFKPSIPLMRQPQESFVPVNFTPNPQPASRVEPPKSTEPEADMGPYFGSSSNMFDNPFDRMVSGNMNIEPALPPRPAAPRPVQWGTGFDFISPYSPPEYPPFARGIPAEYPPGFLCEFPVPNEPVLPNPYTAQQPQPSSDNTLDSSKNAPIIPYSRIPTPPPPPPSEMSSPPLRRTKVSIPEIVEDTTQQPPTPTSDSGGLKRKAEVLDEAVEEPATEILAMSASLPTPGADASAVDTPVVDAAVAEAEAAAEAAIAQRPKMPLRRRLGGAFRTAAAYMVPGVVGAAASIAFLTSVPNDFFVA